MIFTKRGVRFAQVEDTAVLRGRQLLPSHLIDRYASLYSIRQRLVSGESIDLPTYRLPLESPVWKYEKQKRRFSLHGDSPELTPIEFTLLHALFASPGRVFLRNGLLDKLYPGGELVLDRVIEVHVGKLRKKISADRARPKLIHMVRGLGCRFSDPE